MAKVRVAVLGGSGYTAGELIDLLLRHPQVEIVAVTSRQEGQVPVAELHPRLAVRTDLRCEPLVAGDLVARGVQCAFSCLPHGASIAAVAPIVAAGVRVIDLSADYRLRDPVVYARWYKEEHADPAGLAQAVYGLPELFGDRLAAANLVANPGCYPQSAILGLAPLLTQRLIKQQGIIIDSKSGVSGAGRQPSATTHFPECNESVAAYNVGQHRHTPEIEQVLTDVAGQAVSVIFTPHLIPMDRGIFTTVYAEPIQDLSEADWLQVCREFYVRAPFVRVTDRLPATKHTMMTNYCDITVRRVADRIIVLSCLDNLRRGASGVAVQNFNFMFGFPETTALI